MWYYYASIGLFLISLFCSFLVKSRFKAYADESNKAFLTAEQVAYKILNANGINDVSIRSCTGNLTDNYNPSNKTLNLSEGVYGSTSISAIAVAAHECGHAIQHAESYPLIVLRTKIVPVANISSYASYFIITLGLALDRANLIGIGALLFSIIVLFNLVTLPIEIDASKRALKLCTDLNVFTSETEYNHGKKVLDAAALTYFVALASALLTLLRYVTIANSRKRD